MTVWNVIDVLAFVQRYVIYGSMKFPVRSGQARNATLVHRKVHQMCYRVTKSVTGVQKVTPDKDFVSTACCTCCTGAN